MKEEKEEETSKEEGQSKTEKEEEMKKAKAEETTKVFRAKYVIIGAGTSMRAAITGIRQKDPDGEVLIKLFFWR